MKNILITAGIALAVIVLVFRTPARAIVVGE